MPTYWKGYTFLLFLASCPVHSGAIKLSQCLADVKICANSSSNCILNVSNTTAFSILRTSQGRNVTSADDATALSYAGCIQYCGTGLELSGWTAFAHQFLPWLLPYLALVSQLPFGANRRMDNIMSAVLTLGSPTLAGYSLYMTLLNARWVNDELFGGIDYPSAAVRRSVVRVLSSLQQVPLRIHPGESGRFESLVVHPDNDNWWTILAEELDFSPKWSTASGISIFLVVLAYLLTVVASISTVDNFVSNGFGTGSGWLWLLPIVVGWLVLSPKCNYRRVHDAYHKANRQVFVADSVANAAPTSVVSKFGLTINRNPDWLFGRDVVSPDESRIPPVFNYARIFSWYRNVYLTSLFYRAAWRKSDNRVGVDGKSITGDESSDVPRAARLGTREQIIHYCRPDDSEYTAADVLWPRGLFFNMIVASLMSLLLQWGTTGAAFLVVWFTPTIGLGCRSLAYLLYGLLSTFVWMFLVLSSALGCCARHQLHDQRPFDFERDNQRMTLGVPSRPSRPNPRASPTDGGLVVSAEKEKFTVPLLAIHTPDDQAERENVRPERDWATLAGPSGSSSHNHATSPTDDGPVVSPAHFSPPLRGIHTPTTQAERENPQCNTDSDANTTTQHRFCTRQICARRMLRAADWLRWIGKSLAIVNAIIIVANSIFQYVGVYTNCYCDSSVFWWGASAFNVIQPNSNDVDLARSAWIGALALALSCCSFFVGSIYVVRDSLPR